MVSEKHGDAINLSHHLSDIARARQTSPLKGLAKYLGNPGLISLAGGMPNPAYFPFASVSGEALVPDSYPLNVTTESSSTSWFWKLFSSSGSKERTTPITIGKYPKKPEDVNLATALQYGMATGLPQLKEVLKEFVEKVYQPAYGNWTTLIHTGNTDGWAKAVLTLLNPGEGILCSEWTYPSALASALPFSVTPVPVAMDGQGMRSDALRKVLAEWDEEARGMPRPHVLYTVPVGQNPTGATMLAARKKEIYAVCVEYDIVIVEDDPYYFLQVGDYVPESERANQNDLSSASDDVFIAGLAPSYLKFDYQGRVIRLDTFSKTVAPGSRLGWYTCNPMFAERLERAAETSTQAPSGFSQTLVTSLLLEWKYDGYIRWLKGLRVQYKQRRDYFVDCLAEEFHLRKTVATQGYRAGATVLEASLKPKGIFVNYKEKDVLYSRIFSLVPPTAGMFVWLEMHFEEHPSFAELGYKKLENKLWIALAEAGVLFGPGQMFSATPVTNETEGNGHFRISFSFNDNSEMRKAVAIFGTVARKFFSSRV
ncbi:PLP-dependent transferase [Dendrothele bispora CBS 962.96]|uniref:PLP-dependent transferase n=1 Tax=Dendrothele bispora (strain CBS 962.96) TaxID=1314807 RepID=A0A4S8MYV7_DENBC|nr:PLP-dependent transferase [Dendrothele bispora CBS 962.96]